MKAILSWVFTLPGVLGICFSMRFWTLRTSALTCLRTRVSSLMSKSKLSKSSCRQARLSEAVSENERWRPEEYQRPGPSSCAGLAVIVTSLTQQDVANCSKLSQNTSHAIAGLCILLTLSYPSRASSSDAPAKSPVL